MDRTPSGSVRVLTAVWALLILSLTLLPALGTGTAAGTAPSADAAWDSYFQHSIPSVLSDVANQFTQKRDILFTERTKLSMAFRRDERDIGFIQRNTRSQLYKSP